jgi:predicted O-methyltransferase YrrM
MPKIVNYLPANIKVTLARYYLLPHRVKTATSYYKRPITQIPKWLVNSKEVANFTYDLSDKNKMYMVQFISVVTGCDVKVIKKYIQEIEGNKDLIKKIKSKIEVSNYRYMADKEIHFGRRICWYAFVRAVKPKVVVETGVDKGLGACILTAALLKNSQEGFKGVYFGTDIDPSAGYFLDKPYDKFGTILYGDSIESLKKLKGKIDIFINDSDHSAGYEKKEFQTIKNKLSSKAIIIGDNSHVTAELSKFAEETGKKFLFFHEEPKDHWYPGGGVGVAFK